MFFNAAQSLSESNVDDEISVKYDVVENVIGSGRVRSTENDVIEKSILTITVGDNL